MNIVKRQQDSGYILDVQRNGGNIHFIPSILGSPVTIVLPRGTRVLIEDWQQYGEQLDENWVRKFYGEAA